MGGTISIGQSSRHKNLKSKKEVERQRKQDEARRKQLLETYGVLIPPVFLANKTDNPPLSSKVWEKVAEESSSAQIESPDGTSDLLSWAYRRNTSDGELDAGPLLGQTLLTEYMTPGLFLSLPIAASGANDGGRFVAALTQQSKDAATSSLPSFLSLTKRFDQDSSLFFPYPWKIETFLPQNSVLSPSSSNDQQSLPSSMRVVADLSGPSNKNQTQVSWTTHFLEPTSGSTTTTTTTSSTSLWKDKLQGSWIEAETIRNNFFQSGINLRMASAMTVDCFVNQVVLGSFRAGNDAYLQSSSVGNFVGKHKRQAATTGKDETVRLRMAAEYRESILASSTNLCLSSLIGNATTPIVTNTDTLLSLNLNGGTDEAPSQQPPLWLTLQQIKGYATPNSPSSFAITLSQVVTFDREIWNILEDRAPKVRNHLGWVCQVQRNATSTNSESILSMGASAQFNRNIATKVLFESKLAKSATADSASTSPSAALKWAVVLKRWLEPQASLSVLQKVDLVTGKWSFLGIGLEIEQNRPLGSTSSNKKKAQSSTSKRSDAEYRTTADIDASSSVAPPTKVRVELPQDRR